MGYRRGKFGIEYNPPPEEPERHLLLRLLGVALLVALVSLAVAFFRRHRSESAAPGDVEIVIGADPAPDASAADPAAADAKPPPVLRAGMGSRPPAVRNLLLRLEEAEKSGDVEMAATTIERLRSLPGSPAADLDDALARRLGALNMRRLLASAKWVAEVTVRRGDSASRIAAEHGSTLASLRWLNGDVSRIRAGARLRVMNHPHFNLVVHRRTRTADLHLEGRFFKRYYLPGEVTGPVGAFTATERLRARLAERGIPLAADDCDELAMLLPRESQVTVSDL